LIRLGNISPRGRDEATSSEMRHDWLADRWVIIAPQRTARPDDFVRMRPTYVDNHNCPFCFGNEAETPDAIACYYPPAHGSTARDESPVKWRVRVVPNKFPAVRGTLDELSGVGSSPAPHTRKSESSTVPLPAGQPQIAREARIDQPESMGASSEATGDRQRNGEDAPRKQCFGDEEGGPASIDAEWSAGVGGAEVYADRCVDLFHRRDLCGGHEVIVESPFHLQSITQLDRINTALIFRAYRDRLACWLSTRKTGYAVIFKNVGQDAGASLYHTHSQLIATDVIPRGIERTAERMQMFAQREGVCLFCRMQEDEIDQGIRVVEETPDFVAFCPFASRLPALVTIVPKSHQSQFEKVDDAQLDQLSWLTHRLVRRIERCFPEAAYNFVIHTAPRLAEPSGWFHWRLELFPRLTKVAGFEWGSDCYINPLAPEAAADALRRVGV
jgi:galactose-1-phosphate uridylyltransferase